VVNFAQIALQILGVLQLATVTLLYALIKTSAISDGWSCAVVLLADQDLSIVVNKVP